MERAKTTAPAWAGGAKQAIGRGWWLATLAAVLAMGAAAAGRAEEAAAKPATAAAASDGPYRVGGDVAPPRKLHGVPPSYTPEARAARTQGIVIVEAVIDDTGAVTGTRVLKGLGMGLDQAAVDAVAQWQFEPAKRAGQPVPVYFILTVNFKIDSDFDISPWLASFMRQHTDFGALVHARRYSEARVLLDLWGTEGNAVPDAELRMARAYVLLGERRPRDAWLEVEGLDAEGVGDAVIAIASFASTYVSRDDSLAPDVRAAAIESGLAAADLAIELHPDHRWAVIMKCNLLRSRALTTADDEERRALLAEAAALWERAESLAGRRSP